MIFAETERLILRSWTEDDIPAFAAINSDKKVMKHFPAPLSAEESRQFYNRITAKFEEKGYGLYAVELKQTGGFIGYVGLHEIGFEADFTPGVEIGWRLDSRCHNQGLATEAALQVLELARLSGLTRIHSFTATTNKPSERVMQKIGMTKQGTFLHPKVGDDSPLKPHVLYSINL